MEIDNFAVSLNFFGRHSLEYALNAVSDIGFRKVELWGNVAHMDLFDMDREVYRIDRELRKRKLRVISLYPDMRFWNLADDDENERERAKRLCQDCIAACRQLQIPRLIVSMGYFAADIPAEAKLKRAVREISELSDIAEREEIRVLAGMEGLSPKLSRELMRLSFDERFHFGIAADILDFMDDQGETKEWFEMADRAELLHMSDGPGQHLTFGDGCFPIVEMIQKICRKQPDAGRTKEFVIVQNSRKYVLEPLESMRRTAETIRRIPDC